MKGDVISRQDAIDALWKNLYEYEDKTEKQFQKSEDLDVGDWMEHRIFVQNMNDIDRQTILNLPSAQPETAKRIVGMSKGGMTMWYQCDMCHEPVDEKDAFCRGCGRRLVDE